MERVDHSEDTGYELQGSWGKRSLQAAGAWQGCDKLRGGWLVGRTLRGLSGWGLGG